MKTFSSFFLLWRVTCTVKSSAREPHQRTPSTAGPSGNGPGGSRGNQSAGGRREELGGGGAQPGRVSPEEGVTAHPEATLALRL